MAKDSPSRKQKLSDAAYKQHAKTLRELTRGFDAKDGIKLNTKLNAAAKRKITRAIDQYKEYMRPDAYLVKVPQIKNRKKVLGKLQEFAGYSVQDKNARAVLVPATAYSDEKINLKPAKKGKKSSGVYYDAQGNIELRERGGKASSKQVKLKRNIDIKRRALSREYDAFDMFYDATEFTLGQYPPSAFFMIVTEKGPTKFGGTAQQVLALLRKWALKYGQTQDIAKWLKGLRAFNTEAEYMSERQYVVVEQQQRAKVFKAAKLSKRRKDYAAEQIAERARYSRAQMKRVRLKGRR